MKKILINCWVLLALLFCTGAFGPLLTNQAPVADAPMQNTALQSMQQEAKQNAGDPTEPEPVHRALQAVVYGFLAILLWSRRREMWQLVRETKLLWLLIAFCFLSVGWSEVPGFAFRRCVFLAASSALGLYCTARLSPRQLLRMLACCILLCAVASLFAGILFPDLGIDPTFNNHSWRGVFEQKNSLGRVMSMGVVLLTLLAFDSKRMLRWTYAGGALLCLALVGLSRSATSALMLPLLLALLFYFRRSQSQSLVRSFALPVAVIVALCCLIPLAIEPSDLLLMAGRDQSLSGRMDIWSLVVTKIMQRPWLGYGYASFWLGFDGSASADIWTRLHWHVPHSHNGFLDLMEQVGFVGAGLFFAGFVLAFRRAFLYVRINPTYLGLWPLLFLAFTLLFNLTEGSLLRQDNIFWALYVSAFTLVVVRTNAALQDAQERVPRIRKALAEAVNSSAEPTLGAQGV